MNYYQIYSLKVASAIEFPILQPADRFDVIDLEIRLGETPEKLTGDNVLVKVKNQSRPGEFLMTNPVANFYITDGTKIIVEVKDKSEWSFIQHHLLTKCMAVIARQRGWLPIHSSAVSINGKAVLFVGNSGAGKSTTASFLVKRGYSFVADDICILSKNGNDSYHLSPAYPNIRLWKDSIAMVGQDTFEIKEKVMGNIEKFNVDPQILFDPTPIPISHIYFIRLSQNKHDSLEQINKVEGLFYLLEHTYSKPQMQGMGGYKDQFETFSHLLKNIKIKIANRSLHNHTPENMIDLIENDLLNA